MVTATELPPDHRIAVRRELPKDVHADLAGGDERPPPTLSRELLDRKAEHRRCGFEDGLRGDRSGFARREQIGEHSFCHGQIQRDAVESCVRADPVECTLEFADVVLDVGGDEVEDVMGDVLALAFGLLAQDGEAGFELGRLDVGDEPPLEAAAEAVFQRGDGFWGTVRGDDDLAATLMEEVERVEELLLRAFLAFHELDVVDEEHIAVVAEAALERSGGVRLDGIDELGHERLS